ncbi:arginine--tRNA ligase [Candidatus Saccharibacteria bacterium]|nr:arginine--tRNA ligase [Candidatus Saccharibacteria bacterium]
MEEIRSELEKVVKLLFGVEIEAVVVVAEGQEFSDGREADFASNVAMRLAKEVGQAPREIATEILNKFEMEGCEGEVAGPGFLNFCIGDSYYLSSLAQMIDDFDNEVKCDRYAGQTVICEFSDPNPFKVLHVGHLYTSVVGDAISRLFEYAGAKVIRANFGGDVGLHVSKTLYALTRNPASLAEFRETAQAGGLLGMGTPHPQPGKPSVSPAAKAAQSAESSAKLAELLAKCYVEGTRAYEEDEVARGEIDELNREIYGIVAEDKHDSELAKVYWAGREASYEYFKEFYAKLGVEFDEYYPESEVAGRGLAEVKAHPEVYVDSDGAKVFRGEEYGLHTRVFVNKMGLPTYEAKDVGLLFTKWNDFHFDKSVVITGNEIIDYMKVVLKSVSLYAPELVERTTHLTHGMVRLPGNEKMSSRKGNFVRAVDVIGAVESFLLESSSTDAGDSHKLVMAALKYAFLKYKMGGDIEFDAKSSVAVTGNSGIYLEYATVRAKKILEKLYDNGEEQISKFTSPVDSPSSRVSPSRKASRLSGARSLNLESASSLNSYNLSSVERLFVKKICQYKGVLMEAVEGMAPHLVCNYLYELAQEFSRFYEKVKVVDSEYEAERGRIVAVYLAVLEHGLRLLGIETVEEM